MLKQQIFLPIFYFSNTFLIAFIGHFIQFPFIFIIDILVKDFFVFSFDIPTRKTKFLTVFVTYPSYVKLKVNTPLGLHFMDLQLHLILREEFSCDMSYLNQFLHNM